MRRAALFPLAASALLIAVAPALPQSQQRPGRASRPAHRSSAARSSSSHRSAARNSSSSRRSRRKPRRSPTSRSPSRRRSRSAIRASTPSATRSPRSPSARTAPALAKLIVAKDFFWLGEKGDGPTRSGPASTTSPRALNLDAKDGSGWEALTGYAADPTGMPLPDKKDTICAPADPVFDDQAARDARQGNRHRAKRNGAIPFSPASRCAPPRSPNAPVIEKLGMHFVRVMEDDGPAPPRQPDADAQGGDAVRQGRLRAGRRRQPAGQRPALLRQGRGGLEDRRLRRRRAVSHAIAPMNVARAGIGARLSC